jgi:hypothetical protein
MFCEPHHAQRLPEIWRLIPIYDQFLFAVCAAQLRRCVCGDVDEPGVVGTLRCSSIGFVRWVKNQ